MQDSAQVGASEDSAPAAKAPRIATAAGASNPAASDAAAEAPALSIVELAMQAGNMAAAGTSQAATDPAQATTQPITSAPSPVQHPGDTSAAPHAAAANVRQYHVLSVLLLVTGTGSVCQWGIWRCSVTDSPLQAV